MNDQEQLLNLRQVAQILNVQYNTAYRLVHSGRLAGVWVGGAIRVKPETLQNYIEENKITPKYD